MIHPDGGSGTPDNVKKNQAGQVVEVDYPNNTKRQFGYDSSGKLDKIVQQHGEVDVLKNGQWTLDSSQESSSGTGEGGPAGQPISSRDSQPDIVDASVGPDGTLNYSQHDGTVVNAFSDGTQTAVTKNLTMINSDANGNVTEISYPNGDDRQFSYDQKTHQLTSIVENGKTYTVKQQSVTNADGSKSTESVIYGPDGKPTGQTNPSVESDGTYTYTDQNNNFVRINTDQSQVINTESGGTITKDSTGKTTEIDYSGGKSRKFGYNSNGQLDSITDVDGKTYTFAGPLDEWVDSNGNPAKFSNPYLSADGTYNYTDANSKIVSDFTNGMTTTTSQTTAQIYQDATDIHDAAAISAIGVDQSAKINAILNKLSPADAAQLEAQYQNTYGVSLSSALTDGLSKDTSGQQILTSSDVRTAALESLPPSAISKSGSYTTTLDAGPYKGWTVSSLHTGPGQDVVSLINPNNQLTEVDRADGSKVQLQYASPNDALWSTMTDSQSGLTYKRTANGTEEIGANGKVIDTHSGVWVNADGTISKLDNPTQVSQLLHFDAGVSPQVQEQVTKEVNSLPANVQQMLLQDKTLIEITPYGVGPQYGGYTNYPDHRLVIGGATDIIEEAVAHEIAHAVDGYNLHITSSPGFQAAIDQDLKNGLPRDPNSYAIELADPPKNPKYGFGEGDLYAEIAAGLLGYDQSGAPSQMMKDYPTLTAYLKQQLGLDGNVRWTRSFRQPYRIIKV